jgi:uncharacterized membrane protein YgcG
MKGFQVRMKKAITFSVLTIFALILTACGSSASAQGNNASGQSNGNSSTPLPESAKLLIGTLKLDGTPQAVTAQQAAQLIPLWQLLESLETSNTAASQEVDATVQQIQSAMTTEQIQAIDGMNITRRDEFTTLQQMGLVPANASGTPAPGGRTQGQGGGGFGGGGFGGGGFGGGGNPGGGGGGQGNRTFNPSQIATAQAARAAGGGANRLPSTLIDALIKYLQTKSGS